jgi:hypothetical protein
LPAGLPPGFFGAAAAGGFAFCAMAGADVMGNASMHVVDAIKSLRSVERRILCSSRCLDDEKRR